MVYFHMQSPGIAKLHINPAKAIDANA